MKVTVPVYSPDTAASKVVASTLRVMASDRPDRRVRDCSVTIVGGTVSEVRVVSTSTPLLLTV